jgi:hypothetical protein
MMVQDGSPTALGNEACLPPQTLSVGALGNLDTNGDLYVMLPDGDPDITPIAKGKGFYIFSVSAIKYSLTLRAITNGTPVTLANNTPTFCVGQQIIFAPQFTPALPSGVPQDTPKWVFSGTFVNTWTNANANSSTNYFENTDLLLSQMATNWWVSGGYSPAANYNADFGETLTFPSGASGSVVANASVNMFRPQMIQFTPVPPFIPMESVDRNTDNLLLGLGDHFYGGGDMQFQATVQSTDFSGELNWTQLNKRDVTSPFHSTSGQYWLDNAQFYNTVSNIVGGTPDNTRVTSISNSVVSFEDDPDIAFLQNESITDNFKTYLTFKPDGDSIWVTLGVATWGWSASVTNGSIQATNVIPPSYTNSTDLPVWPNVGRNHPGHHH